MGVGNTDQESAIGQCCGWVQRGWLTFELPAKSFSCGDKIQCIKIQCIFYLTKEWPIERSKEYWKKNNFSVPLPELLIHTHCNWDHCVHFSLGLYWPPYSTCHCSFMVTLLHTLSWPSNFTMLLSFVFNLPNTYPQPLLFPLYTLPFQKHPHGVMFYINAVKTEIHSFTQSCH